MFQPWPDSVLSLDKVQDSAFEMFSSADSVVVWLCLVLLFLSVLFFNRISAAIVSSSAMFGGEVRMNETLRSSFKRNSMSVTYIFLIPFYAVFFSLSGISALEFWKILAIVAGFFVFRYVILGGVRLINGSSDALERVEKLGFATFIIIGVLLLAALVLMRFFSGIPDKIFKIYCIAVVVAIMPGYLLRERKFFLGSRFSHFFWFLYLCAFEILPICVVVKAVVS